MPHTLTRSLLTILIPGLISIAPWLIFLSNENFPLNLPENPVIKIAIAFALVAVMGSVFEGIGTYIEYRWDQKREEAYDVKNNWYQYLSSTLDPAPIGYRYLSKLVTNLYFELSMLFAAPISIIGIAVLANKIFENTSVCLIVLITISFATLSIWYFKKQADNTHEVLCVTRQEINKRVNDK